MAPWWNKSTTYRGVGQLAARQAHNLKIVRSNRTSATYPSNCSTLGLRAVDTVNCKIGNQSLYPAIIVVIFNLDCHCGVSPKEQTVDCGVNNMYITYRFGGKSR